MPTLLLPSTPPVFAISLALYLDVTSGGGGGSGGSDGGGGTDGSGGEDGSGLRGGHVGHWKDQGKGLKVRIGS